jgi:transcription elongation factor GreA-like protein
MKAGTSCLRNEKGGPVSVRANQRRHFSRAKTCGETINILEWLGDAVLESDRTEHAAREQSIKRLQARYEQIQARIDTMYMDKVDARISQDFFDEQAGQCRWAYS